MKAMARNRQSPEEEHYWPSFTDVMSSIVFVLFFFIVIFFIKQIVSAKNWDSQLTKASATLSQTQKQLDDAQKRLDQVNSALGQKKTEMSGLEKSLSEREARINDLESQLSSDQQALRNKETELTKVKGQIEEISLLRLSLLKEVKSSIEKELSATSGKASQALVTIDDNANLVIQSSLLFAKGSSEISESGRKMLQKFAVAFEKILSKASMRESVDSIIISGYADSDDTYENNYTLSCERAIAVINTMMQENPELESAYGSYFQASGFSEFRPVAKGSDEASKAKNRRIQISINIKDSSIQKIINDYMSRQP
ncbi:MAG: OmpA family protein [Clostridia bacterium]|nr:OmpA family protein [Clostridia bacterium]